MKFRFYPVPKRLKKQILSERRSIWIGANVICFSMVQPVLAQTTTYTGNQAANGVAPASPPTLTVEMRDILGEVVGTNVAGINLRNNQAGNVRVETAQTGAAFNIRTTGNNAKGITVMSVGTPTPPGSDPFLGIPIPTSQSVAGGVVTVENSANITTAGNDSQGIHAQSSTSGFPPQVAQQLNDFVTQGRAANFTFAVSAVANKDNSAGTVGSAVTASRVDQFGDAVTGGGGKITLNANGTYSFDANGEFADVAVGGFVNVRVNYTVTTTKAGGGGTQQNPGFLVIRVQKTGATTFGTPTLLGSNFSQFGSSTTVFPNLNTYVSGLLATTASGGAGNSVTVNNDGAIRTTGVDSHGILATSQGSRGGDGSDATLTSSSTQGGNGSTGGTVTVNADGSIGTTQDHTAGIIAWSLGGDGGQGGDSGYTRNSKAGGAGAAGGNVIVRGDAIITTSGLQSSGIIALSQGGNGGGGGSGSTFNSADDGGNGGQGGSVDVNGTWDITTTGNQAHGIWAKSTGGVAGGGGNGGWTGTGAGGGGVGTSGGNVSLISGGTIRTTGTDSYGLYAESIGGFGGGGGSGTSIFYASGGSGASAGSGGNVSATNSSTGNIITTGARGHGIFAQSVGGGGGSGGGGGALVGLGGSGSTGGNGGTAAAANQGFISATGEGARGMFVQSVGGGGGDGGNGVGLAAVGGSGSGTSDGGVVTANNTGTITSASSAIFAQSIGGGGGSGGSSVGWFSFGGTAGGGGDGANVLLSSKGNLTTTENNASAIFAQSVGGGGGNGGNSVAVGAVVSVAIGGAAAEGGDGKTVRVGVNTTTGAVDAVTGIIATSGDYSRGIQAQSVGGGGGNGGFAASVAVNPSGASAAIGIGGTGGKGGDAGEVDVYAGDAATRITTDGNDAHGIFAQSVGGGGGSGGFAVSASLGMGISASLAIGGDGAEGGDAGLVNVGSASNLILGNILTQDIHSYGIFAQSVGGGGGDGGFSVAGSLAQGGLGASLSFGGDGAKGGVGKDVNLYSGANVTTQERDSHGIFAQSVGGGGGSGGFSVAGSISTAAVNLSFGGDGGAGGAAGNVMLHSSGTLVSTSADHSYGLLAQSIGGGGGDGGFSVTGGITAAPSVGFSMGGSGSAGGAAGTVTLHSSSSVSTDGRDSHAIFAQSVGGGGGSGGFSVAASISVDPTGSGAGAAVNASIGGDADVGGNAEGVTVSSTGDNIWTNQARSYGILAQSVGGGGGDGGFSVAGGISSGPAVSFSMGGTGAGGGNAGKVVLESTSDISTIKENSHAIVAQSIGGGGGTGGFSVAGGLSSGSASVSASVGGAGGAGGVAGDVEVGNISAITGTITTEGDDSYGILAQSIGGGGGTGGFSIAGGVSSSASVNFSLGGFGGTASHGFNVILNSAASIGTKGRNSHAIFAQSVGGGGGSGGFSVTGGASSQSAAVGASIGGFGAGGGNGQTVTVNSSGDLIVTEGDHANGIHAQSIGGGGGDGGFSVAGGVSKSTAANFSIGGFGDDGGTSGLVDVTNSSDIITSGETAHGIFAQSVGGGGGSGGFALAGSVSSEANGVTFALGGFGAKGGTGGEVKVDNSGNIGTGGTDGLGKGSYGILAQSIGGGGGSGGFSGAFTATVGKTDGKGMSLSIGGYGDEGGSASTVDVINTGIIETLAADSIGIFAQSVGGGGGNGGFSLAATLSTAQEKASLSVSIGGKGAGGGNGQTVTVNNSNLVLTSGANSQGIFAQSLGGGGGNGGFSVVANGATGNQAKSVGVSVGGAGAAGGNGGWVSVTNTGSIGTKGNESAAIQAQSIGGSGGNGGFSITGSLAGLEGKSLGVSVGGDGGAGGAGGVVEVLGDGEKQLVTEGENSHGVFAQSIGGGGGNGGFSAAVALGAGGNDPNKPSTSISVSVGGDGGTGNTGGSVNVGNAISYFTGDITTLGTDASGIFAQSIGGGGGTGGYSLAASMNLATGTEGSNTNLAVAVGGSGGSGNHGGKVEVFHNGSIGTAGDGSHGIEAQSVGGGGGNGGDSRAITLQLGRQPTPEEKEKAASNKSLSLSIGGAGQGGGDGGMVTVNNVGDILTTGGDAYGIFAQSIGGGGGTGGDAHFSFDGATALKKYDRSKFAKDLKIVVGGGAGGSGSGALVDVTHTGNIATTGMGSHGIFAQSVGAGGGTGGSGVLGATGSIGIGGGTGSSGHGGDVSVTLNGDIDTYEDGADGISAQSVGGGGGRAGNVDRGLKNYLNVGIGLAFGQSTGNSGDGGDVTIRSTGDITTRGMGSNGIFAQSVGGGGGVAGSLGNDLPLINVLNFAGSVGGAGSGGIIDIIHTGDIATLGDASDGIWAQSAGGQNTGDTVDIQVMGDVIASGHESNAIFAQSIGQGGNGDITIDIFEGMVQGGGDSGAGVRIMDGKDNTLTNRGTIQTMGLLAGTAIIGGTGNETVENVGTVNGNVRLGGGTNVFEHHTGALLQSGAIVDLGAGNEFRNAGTISTGGLGTLQTTTLTGDFVQTGDAIWNFDIKPDFTSDRFDIDGTASLGSFINRVNLNQNGIASSPGRYTLITTDSGLTGTFRFGSMAGGTMPVGYTFTLVNSDTTEELDLAESTGDFYWRGGAGNMWNGAFVDGESNWTRTTSATDYIYGTPGALCDVFFSSDGAEYRDTVLGADFSANSLTFFDTAATSINGDNTLTIAAAGGQGITVEDGAGEVRITSDLMLGADQTWTNDSENLLIISGDTLGGAGFDLTLDGSGVTVISSIIQTGTGSLIKDGSGLVALYGASTYSGGTIIDNGIIEAGNVRSLGSGHVSLNEGVLRTVNGASAPAATALHLAIGGNYTQQLATDLQLRIIGPSGVSDRLDIDGTATLGGVFRPDYSALNYNPVPPAGDYTDEFLIVHADGGINGHFDGFADVHYNPDRLLRWEPVYEQNDVYLLWNQHPFTEIDGLSDNQFAVGDVLNRATGIIPAMPMAYNDSTGASLLAHPGLRSAITYLNNRSLADLPVDYDLIAPEELTAIFDSGRAFTQVETANIENRLQEIRDGQGGGFSARGLSVQKKPMSFSAPMPVASSSKGEDVKKEIEILNPQNPWGFFIAGSAESMDVGSDGNASGFDTETGGVTLGIDFQPNEHSAVGLFQQYTNSDADLTNDGSVDMDGMKFGLYGTVHNDAGFYANGLVAAGTSDYETKRLGLNGEATGDTDGWDFDAMIGGGYSKRVGALSFGPLASLIYSRQQVDQFTETGSMLPLVIDDQSEDSLVSRIGIEASYEFQVGEVIVAPSISLAWEHEFLRDAYDIDSRLAAADQNGFTTSGPDIGRDSLDIRAGLGVQWNRDFSTYISYQCEVGRSNYQNHSITLGLHHQF